MESIRILSPYIPGLDIAIHKSIIENKSVKECFETVIDNKAKCFKCKNNNNGLKLIQMKSNSRCSDELIESHYFCKTCRKQFL